MRPEAMMANGTTQKKEMGWPRRAMESRKRNKEQNPRIGVRLCLRDDGVQPPPWRK